MTRTLPRQKLLRSPLIHVLLQVRFAPVLDMESRISEIRHNLLGQYPRFEESQIRNIILDPATSAVRIDAEPRWDFLDRLKERGVVLTKDFVLFHTRRYDTFEEFLSAFRPVLDAVRKAAAPALVVRVGLRYVDLVRPGDEEAVSAYLIPALAGYAFSEIPNRLEGSPLLSRVETVATTTAGHLAVRCFHRNDGNFLPPDLMPSVLDYSSLAVPPGETVAILDIDHANSDPIDFALESIESAVTELHDATDRTFRAVVTEHALEKWGQEIAS